ncbi:MAG: hypothetical protein ABEH77_06780 [Halobacteriaceae archaeon]
MTRLQALAALAVLALFVGTGAAAPTAQTADQPGTPDRPGGLGPLPDQVPAFVGDLLDTVERFLDGLFDGVAAGAPAGTAGADADASGETARVTTTDDSGAAGTTTATTATAPGRPYSLTVERVEACGETCREVTTTLANEQSTAATGVTVHTRVYAGDGTDGEFVWEGTESVGDLAAGDSYTATERIDLSLMEAYAVRQAGGTVTIETTVESAGGTVTFTEQRDVA